MVCVEWASMRDMKIVLSGGAGLAGQNCIYRPLLRSLMDDYDVSGML
jgi:hypothetical protein|tara:strand:+ start:1301 stop:1441 length:141 start_codon:yes stop_codon:yes gene_type:complete